MKRRPRLFLVVVLSLLASLSIAYPIKEIKGQKRTWTVPGDYLTIDQAIIAAEEGDTILVSEGEYSGFLIDKQLTIVGTGRNKTKVISPVIIEGSNAKLMRMNIDPSLSKDYGPTIQVEGRNNQIIGNNFVGKILVMNDNNLFQDNYISEGYQSHISASNNKFYRNTFENNGVSIFIGSNNEFVENNFYSERGHCLHITTDRNLIFDNTFENVYEFLYCVGLSGASDIVISCNQFKSIAPCISLGDLAYDNQILYNKLEGDKSKNSIGIEITSLCSDNTDIIGNTIKNCYIGILISQTTNTGKILSNNFIDNEIQAQDNSNGVTWFYNRTGNFWNDWVSPDDNHDGIVDNPYVVPGEARGVDKYPLETRYIYNPEQPTESEEQTEPESADEEDSLFSVNVSIEILLAILAVGVIIAVAILTLGRSIGVTETDEDNSDKRANWKTKISTLYQL